MNCFRIANVIKNTTITTILNNDDCNITKFKAQHYQIIRTITYRTLKFESVTKKSVLKNHTFFTIIRINSIT